MFRLLASNTGQSLRPVLLRNVRSNTSPLKLSGATNASMDLEKNFQFRTNATLASGGVVTQGHPNKADSVYPGFPVDKQDSGLGRNKLSRFEEVLSSAMSNTVSYRRKPQNAQRFESVRTLANLFRDDSVKDGLTSEDLFMYTNVLNEAVYINRLGRLNDTRNRDSDLYQNVSLLNDIWLKNAILDLAENISHGSLQQIVTPDILRKLFYAMMQLQVNSELISFWENGVNDPQQSLKYLKHSVLSVVLPLTYSEKRFLYDEIIKLYETNTRGAKFIAHNLSVAIGKVAIQEGDYLRALDCLEMVLAYLETKNTDVSAHRNVAELHSAFIGECKDIKIARHFFNKSVENKLPYKVVLKAPHVQKLMIHSMEANEPFETIFEFWKQTLIVYSKESRNVINARYSILNKTFFSIFFQMHPTLTEEGYMKLKEVIATYANIKHVDDYFLNNIITNYTWNDKVVFQQLLENYEAYEVNQTAVSYRVILKKMGEIKGFSNEDILQQWNTTLKFLDGAGFTYIPIADWASLREATILSPFSEERTELYLALLNTYKNYHQDEKAVHRFFKHWMTKPQADQILRINAEETPEFATDVEIVVPEFSNLKENVDYKSVAANLVAFSREDNDSLSRSYAEKTTA